MEAIALLIVVGVLVLITSLLSVRITKLERASKLHSNAIITLANSQQFIVEMSKQSILEIELLNQKRGNIKK